MDLFLGEETMETQISQGLKNTFLIHFIAALVFGISYLFIPQVVGSILGLNIQDAVPYRLLGAAMLGFGASSWLAYKGTGWESVRIVVVMEMVWTILGALVLLYALLFAGYPALVWINAIILAGFAIAFCWFYFKK